MHSSINKFSPGPWNRAGWVEGRHFINTDEGVDIALINSPIYDNSELTKAQAEANAKLIAAAPDLLEALQLVLKNLGWYTAKQHLNEETIIKINAAIAKATQP